MKNAKELLAAIDLEQIEENIYRGNSHSIGGKRVFGGQVLAQSLHAAAKTVDPDRVVHSLHGYFILAGDVNKPIIYDVDRIRDGRSFTTRRVVAIQHGRAIFNMAASFQKSENGADHQITMPNVQHPENLMNSKQILETYGDKLPPETQKWLAMERPIEFRSVEKPNFLNLRKSPPFQHIWIRAIGEMPDDPMGHRVALAYASDYNLLSTAMLPHGLTWKHVVAASLDHAMWFHRDFKANEWLLYVLDSPSASNARGFTRGNMFNLNGELVASVVQEGLIRPRTPDFEK